MSEAVNKPETKVETAAEPEVVKATTIETQPEGKGKKAIKWVAKGLALVATGIVGFLLGRASNGDGEDETAADNETPAE